MGGVSGHAGLFSTASDIGNYAQMILNEGLWKGYRFFKNEQINYFTTIQNIPQESDYAIGWDTPSNNGKSSAGDYYSIGSFDSNGSLEILYEHGSDVAGFQFDVSGLDLSGGSGGAAGDAGFTVSASGSTALGFSFTGSTVAAGSGTLTFVSFDSVTGASTELSLGNFGAVTTSDGQTLDVNP